MSQPAAAEPRHPNRRFWLAVAVLVLVTSAIYANTFNAPFIFDDGPSITANPTIRHLWSWATLTPPGSIGQTVGGRPILNWTFALSYALSGAAPWGFHLLNLVIHILATLTLFGLVRRTLLLPRFAGKCSDAVLPALAAAALWAWHPLQTESVTYIVQRAESLAGLFYLFALYAWLRGVTERRALWHAAAVAACLLGMGTKETVATAPLVVVLFDRVFLAGGFRALWRQRKWPLLALAATWIPLAVLVIAAGSRGGSAGLGEGMSVWAYALTQAQAIVLYLGLVFWPHPLVLDYGTPLVSGMGAVWPQLLLLATLLAATVWAWRRWPAAAFAATAFFLLLAPSSSIVPVITQTMAEHRMYLPLATLVVLAVVLAVRRFGRPAVWTALCAALAMTPVTWARNQLYRDPVSLWHQTLSVCPNNPRAHLLLGTALNLSGDIDGAIRQYDAALRLKPGYIEALNNLGNALQQQGRLPEAIRRYEQLLRLKPDYPDANYNYGLALLRTGRAAEAVGRFQEALKSRPADAETLYQLATAQAISGDLAAAVGSYQAALRLKPNDPDILFQLGNTLGARGDLAGAISHYEAALRARPDFPAAQRNLNLARQYAGYPQP